MNPRIRIIVAFGLLLFFAFIIWKPNITGNVASGEPERVVVILKAVSNSVITGAVALDESSTEELRASTAVAQQEVFSFPRNRSTP